MNLLLPLILGAIGGSLSARFLWSERLGGLWDYIVGILGGGMSILALGLLEFDTGGPNYIYWVIFVGLGGGACLHSIVIIFKTIKKA